MHRKIVGFVRRFSSSPSTASDKGSKKRQAQRTALDPKEDVQVSSESLTRPSSASASTSASAIHTLNVGGRLILDVVKESADAFPPLKSVLGGLTTLLKYYDVCISGFC